MPAASQYEVSKDWFGRQSVKYECPYCGDRLRSPLREAGNQDRCPTCQRAYTVPGREVLNQVTAAKQSAEEYAAKIKADRLQAKRLRELEQATARAQASKAADEARRERERLAEEAPQVKVSDNASAELDSNSVPAQKSRKRWWVAGGVAATFILLLILDGEVGDSRLRSTIDIRNIDLRSKLERCESKDVVSIRVSYSDLFSTDTILFDLRDGASSGARRIDPVHLLMQFADKLDLSTVQRVVLARNGQSRFYVAGSDLQRLAESYAGGGRVWAFNNLPASVRRMDGTRAFDEWTGGWLGVLKQQTEDLNSFITEWTGYGDSGYSAMPSRANSTVRTRVRKTLREMEDNVPKTLKSMEDNLPEVMADMEKRMMQDAGKYGLSPSDVRAQLRDIEADARKQIRGMEGDVRSQIHGMEDDVVQSLQGQDK
jgi:hypothetical protein